MVSMTWFELFSWLLLLQEKKISKEEDLKRELQELEESFDSMDALEDEIFD